MTGRHTLVSDRQPTGAEMADREVRRHLAAIVVVAQQGTEMDVARMARSEMCRVVSAILASLRTHELESNGECAVCGSSECLLLNHIRRALLPAIR